MAKLNDAYAFIALGDLLVVPPSREPVKWRVIGLHSETLRILVEPTIVKASLGAGPWYIQVEPSSIPESL